MYLVVVIMMSDNGYNFIRPEKTPWEGQDSAIPLFAQVPWWYTLNAILSAILLSIPAYVLSKICLGDAVMISNGFDIVILS